MSYKDLREAINPYSNQSTKVTTFISNPLIHFRHPFFCHHHGVKSGTQKVQATSLSDDAKFLLPISQTITLAYNVSFLHQFLFDITKRCTRASYKQRILHNNSKVPNAKKRRNKRQNAL